MDLFKYDGPFWHFIGIVTDLFILNVLCLICCIPIITIGPALTAKYDVALRIVRREEPAVLKPFFVAFKKNFKQSLIAWLFLLVACVLLMIDWTWMYETGWDNVPTPYFAGAVFVTVIVSFVIFTIFPIISRFELTVVEAFKTSALFSMLYFFGLLAIVILVLFSAFLCIKYFNWLPLILVLSHVVIVFCHCLVLQNGFKKLEARFITDDEEEESSES
ncbi:MAG: DUF624 domain-containing protein [Clostridiales bacterium]|nr:DUF624 domain-containing protein [Clostridiales bacterium]